MNFFQRNPRFTFGQIGLANVQTLGDGVGIQAQQRFGIGIQIHGNKARWNRRVLRQRQYRRGAQAHCRVAL